MELFLGRSDDTMTEEGGCLRPSEASQDWRLRPNIHLHPVVKLTNIIITIITLNAISIIQPSQDHPCMICEVLSAVCQNPVRTASILSEAV